MLLYIVFDSLPWLLQHLNSASPLAEALPCPSAHHFRLAGHDSRGADLHAPQSLQVRHPMHRTRSSPPRIVPSPDFHQRAHSQAILRSPAHPSVAPVLLPASHEGRVRHAPRPSAQPAARAGLLQHHGIERDTLSDYEVIRALTSPPTPYHADTLSDRPPRFSDTPHSSRCRSLTCVLPSLAPGAATIHSGVTPSVFSTLACVHHSWDVRYHRRALRLLRPFPHRIDPFFSPPTREDHPRRSPNYHTRVRSARGDYSSSAAPRSVSALALRRLAYHPAASPGCDYRRRSTLTHPTPYLRTLGARRAAPPACTALDTAVAPRRRHPARC
ncbi:hypothetical protein DFH08DRAFT_1047590 [Mycena albidolilacea]|uniref:Uncharacterized protein n=1 Tax=Mycena albidolilacea TaxID=1033008 RepID=A0AAD7AEP9_9AGAR|nr:hypothetical protein DFH08DRAFT_1047590 [Mycena albidolilacea]